MPDSVDLIYEGSCLKVMLLPDCEDVVIEWDKVDEAKFLHAFAAMDTEVTGPARRWSPHRATKISDLPGGSLVEVRAPARGRRIFRALCFQPRGYDLYIAYASEKKTQKLKSSWIDRATGRIERTQQKGLL